ncbi:hypothetical protein HOY80DRAFT_997808 [Tuber brumale]|nr:hypothetical protein HOY80DRAFT_997808 [Tuber brumale]
MVRAKFPTTTQQLQQQLISLLQLRNPRDAAVESALKAWLMAPAVVSVAQNLPPHPLLPNFLPSTGTSSPTHSTTGAASTSLAQSLHQALHTTSTSTQSYSYSCSKTAWNDPVRARRRREEPLMPRSPGLRAGRRSDGGQGHRRWAHGACRCRARGIFLHPGKGGDCLVWTLADISFCPHDQARMYEKALGRPDITVVAWEKILHTIAPRGELFWCPVWVCRNKIF